MLINKQYEIGATKPNGCLKTLKSLYKSIPSTKIEKNAENVYISNK